MLHLIFQALPLVIESEFFFYFEEQVKFGLFMLLVSCVYLIHTL